MSDKLTWIERADKLTWIERADNAIYKFFTGYTQEITGQQLRERLEAELGPIPNPNAFGPYVAKLVREQAIRPTGNKVKMAGSECHGRLTPVYMI